MLGDTIAVVEGVVVLAGAVRRMDGDAAGLVLRNRRQLRHFVPIMVKDLDLLPNMFELLLDPSCGLSMGYIVSYHVIEFL